MAKIDIRNIYGTIIHSVFVDQARQLFPADLRGLDLSNTDLTGASLPDALLEGTNLRGAKLVDADLRRAQMCSCDLSYSDISGCDLREANLVGAAIYPCGHNKHTKFWDARIDLGSELATMSQAITKAKLRRSDDVEEFDVWRVERAMTTLLDPNTKRLERKIAKERRGWNLIPGNPIIKAQLRVLRYSKEIALAKARREKDLIFLSREGVGLSFAKLNEETT